MTKKIFHLLLLLLTIFLPVTSFAFPQLTDGVVDEANILSDMTEQSVLRMFEQEGVTNVVVATVNSLEGKSVEQYATELGNEWGVGSKRYDNGAILLIAPNEGYVRIATGLGMQHVLTDEKSNIIIQTQMIPYLKKHDYDTAVLVGIQGILASIRNTDAFPNKSHTESLTSSGKFIFYVFLLCILLFIILYIVTAPSQERGERARNVLLAIGSILGILFTILLIIGTFGRSGGKYSGGGRFGGGGATGKF
jgi:uncharacterized protein